MSVIVKGMKMHENCNKCPCCDELGCAVKLRSMTTKQMSGNRPDWCPLVEIPSRHGRLFDETEVKRCLRELPDSEDKWSAIALLEWAIEKRCCIEAEDEL